MLQSQIEFTPPLPFFSLSVIAICIFLLSSILIDLYFFRIKCSVASFYVKLSRQYQIVMFIYVMM